MKFLSNDPTMLILKKGLDACSLRYKIISNNIANAQTPGFKASDTNFKSQIKKVIQQKNEDINKVENIAQANKEFSVNLSELIPQAVKLNRDFRTSDGNNVDIDREMATLAKNSLEFRAYQRSMGDMLTILTSAIRGE